VQGKPDVCLLGLPAKNLLACSCASIESAVGQGDTADATDRLRS
jgi:hypothetical protein